MAIIKFIEIHDSGGISNCLNYVNDPNKNVLHKDPDAPPKKERTGADQVNSLINYSVNPEKTLLKSVDGNLSLVTGVNCSPDFAAEAFQIARSQYYDANNGEAKSLNAAKGKDGNKTEKRPIEAFHIIQSFPELEGDQNDPELVHHLGMLFAKRMFPNHMCVVSTHMNTKHLHNHIVVCAYETDRPKKFKRNLKAYRKMQKVNDEISLEYGLPVLGVDRDPDLEKSIDKELRLFGSGKITTIRMSNGEKEARDKNKSWKQILENTIDSLAASSDSWEDFVAAMSRAGYGIRETKTNITYYERSNTKHRVRATTLGNKTAYTKDNLILQYGLKETSPKTEGIENDHVNDIHNPFSEEIPEESIDVSFVPDYDAVIEKPKDIIPDSLTGKATKAGSSLIFKMPEYDVPKSKPKPLKFHISRYTKFGRRRSDLELIFLAAIRIIAYVKDWFADLAHPEKNPKNIPYIKKIETLQRAMHTANANNITSVEELQLALKECGIELSNQKAIKNDIEKNKDYFEDMVQTIVRLDALRTLHPEIDAGNGTLADMNIRLPDEKEVQKNKALLQPLTPKLRRSLFSLLKEHPELSLKFGWNEMSERLSLSQGRLLNEYLRSLADNPSSPIPESLSDVLETYDEHRKNSKVYFYENLRIKKDKSIKDKYSSLPLNADMFKKLKSLCDEKGLTVNLRSLSMYEGMQILGHYSENELDKPLIDKDQKDILQKAVKDGSITLSRKIDYVTKDEYEAIIRHLKNPKNYCPEVLKSSPPIRPSEAKQIEELLKVKGEKISIPVMELSQEDGDRLFDYLLNKGTTPDIVARIEQEKEDILFENKLASYPEEQRAAFVEYRSLLKKMTDLGVSPSDRRLLTQQLDQMSKALASTQAKVNDLSLKYRSLNNVGKCLVYANDLSFTHGVDFEKGHNKRCEVEFINERSETDRDIFNKEIEQEEIIEGQLKDLSDLSPNDWDGIPETLLNIEQIRQLNMSYISFGVAEANERQKIARLNKEAVKKQEHENEQQPEQERQSHKRKTASPDLGY